MPSHITLGVAQARTLRNLQETLVDLNRITHRASTKGVDLLLFPEAYLGGYPRGTSFGSSIGARTEAGREEFLQYFNDAVDLGDTPRGAGNQWIERKLDPSKEKEIRGDGTREILELTAHDSGVFLVVGLIEKSGGSLYCSVVYVCPKKGCIGKRRKVMPTSTERLVWAQGDSATLRAVTTKIHGVKITLAAAICWENYMPLLRYSLYSQNVNLYLAPTADARDTWVPLLRTIALEGRTFVLSANQCVSKGNLPGWINAIGSAESKSEDSNPGYYRQSSAGQAKIDRAPAVSGERRGSYVVYPIEGGHELCLPYVKSKKEEAAKDQSNMGNDDSEHKHPLPPHNRKTALYSQPEEDGEEVGRSPEETLSPLSERPSTNIPESPKSPKDSTHPRRKSIIYKVGTHELVLPASESSATAHNENISLKERTTEQRSSEFSYDLDPAIPVSESSIMPPLSKTKSAPVPATTATSTHTIIKPFQTSSKLTHAFTDSLQTSSTYSPSDFACRGGSCIISPSGQVLAGPLWEVEDGGLLTAKVDLDDCIRGKLDFDAAGSYSRNDAFELTVKGLDLNPPE